MIVLAPIILVVLLIHHVFDDLIADDLGTHQILQSEYRASFQTSIRPYLQPPSAVAAQNNVSLLHLTLREQQVVLLLTHGLSNAQIGTRLHLSPRTVEKYVKFIKKNYYKQPGRVSKVCHEKSSIVD